MLSQEEQIIEKQLADLRSELAAVRRKHHSGVSKNYSFRSTEGVVSLSDLFQGRSDLLVIHNMGHACSHCTAYADGINGVLAHLEDRTAVALISNDNPSDQVEFAQSRGWNFNLASAKGTNFSKELGFEPHANEFWPGIIGYRKTAEVIEVVSKTYFDPGDDLCAIWPLFSFLEGGAGEWEPSSETTLTSKEKAASCC